MHSILDTVAGSFPQCIQKIIELENVWVGMQYFGAIASAGQSLASAAPSCFAASNVLQVPGVSLLSLRVPGWPYTTWYIRLHIKGGVRPCMSGRWACCELGGERDAQGGCLLLRVVIDGNLKGHRGKLPAPSEHRVLRCWDSIPGNVNDIRRTNAAGNTQLGIPVLTELWDGINAATCYLLIRPHREAYGRAGGRQKYRQTASLKFKQI